MTITSCFQQNKLVNQLTLISTGQYEAILYKGKLIDTLQIQKINSWDSIQINKRVEEIKPMEDNRNSIHLILKATREGGFHGSLYLYRIGEVLGKINSFDVSKLNRREKKLLGYHNE